MKSDKESETREIRSGEGTSAARSQHLGGPEVTASETECLKLKLDQPQMEGHCLLLLKNQDPQIGILDIEPRD